MGLRWVALVAVVASAVVSSRPASAQVGGEFNGWAAFPADDPLSAVIADVTGDGRADAVVAEHNDGRADNFSLRVYAQDEAGGLGSPSLIPTAGTHDSSMWLDSADLEGDGDADVLLATDTGVEVFEQLGGALVSTGVVPTDPALAVDAADVDVDGLADLVVATTAPPFGSGDSVTVIHRLPDGEWGTAETATTTRLQDMEVGDVTCDGLPDVVGVYGRTVYVIPQDGAGSWEPAVTYPTGSPDPSAGGNGVAVGDVTGDGRVDVAVSSGGNKPNAWVSLFPQQADGTLGAPHVRASYDIPRPVEIADLHGDGRLDVITAHSGWGSVGFWSGLPSGTISATEERVGFIGAGSHRYKGLAVGDLTGDGALDIALADSWLGLVMLPAGGPTSPPATTTITSGPAGVITENRATFSFESGDPNAWFHCYALGTSPYGPCASPKTYTDLPVGDHHFAVLAVSPSGGYQYGGAAQRGFCYESTVLPAPSIGSATAGKGSATLSWLRPASASGCPIVGYVVTPYIGYYPQASTTFMSTETVQVVRGLTPGVQYRFRVQAVNAVGTSGYSKVTNPVVPAQLTVPGAPYSTSASPADGQADVTWFTPTEDGGTPITGFEVTPYVGYIAYPATRFTTPTPPVPGRRITFAVTGLTNGKTYRFRIRAINAVGTSEYSKASNAIIPE
jgi:hypothetical protein